MNLKERFNEKFSDVEDIDLVPHLKAHGVSSSKPSEKVLAFFQQKLLAIANECEKQEFTIRRNLAESSFSTSETNGAIAGIRASVELIRNRANELSN